MKAETSARTNAGRAGVGLALAATTAVGMAVPAHAAPAQPSPVHSAVRPGALAAHVRSATPVMTYRVQAGDTVSHIALRTGSSVPAIVGANNLGSRALIRVGQMLRIPSAAQPAPSAATRTAPAPAPAPAPVTASVHTVRGGETLSGIAKTYRTTVPALVGLNSLASANRIYVGQKLKVTGTPAPAPAPAAPAPAPAPAPAGTYTVAAGDTVSALAARWGTTVSAVVQANSLAPSALIYVGQKLTVPGSSTAAPTAPVTQPLVPSTFLGRTYPEATVASANANKATLLAAGVPSRAQMQALVVQVAREMGVDPALAQAHAYQESGFNHASVSPANAIGTMQVIPSSGEWASGLVGRKLNLLDPYDNVVAGIAIIRYHVRTAPNLDTAIASYYQGAGSVKRNGMFSDTKMYVASVRAHMLRF